MGHYDAQYEALDEAARSLRQEKKVAVLNHLRATIEVARTLPASRELSLVLTKLDEARLWLGEVA